MTRIGLISDTHGYIDPKVFDYFDKVDEIWHAGDIGNVETIEKLMAFKPVRAVFGNIDGGPLRKMFNKTELFKIENSKVLMTHIGGKPPRYNPEVRKLIALNMPSVFVCGHSHILRVIYDKENHLLYLNPGAAGYHGFHKVKTLLRFTIDDEKVTDMEVVELGPRTRKIT